MITLRNLQGRMSDPYEIPTTVLPGVPVKRGVLERSRNAPDDPVQVALRVDRKVFPQTVTLAAKGTPGDTSEELPDEVAQVPKIAAAIRERKLAVTKVPARSPAPVQSPPATPPAAPAASADTEGAP